MSDAEKQLAGFLAKYSPEMVKQTQAVLKRLRALYPTATQIVYDNYNALAIGFGPSEKVSEAIFSIAVYPKWISFFFLQWRGRLEDPHGLLKGAGKVVRHIRLEGPETLDDPRVRDLMNQAVRLADVPFDPAAKGRLTIRSVSSKQRSRRPAAAKKKTTKTK